MTYSRGIPARDGGGNGLGTKELEFVGSGGDSEDAGGLGLEGGAMMTGQGRFLRKRRRPLGVKRNEEEMSGVRRLG